jgi:hypothetical protein
MAVLMIAEVPNMTEEMYAGISAQLKPPMQAAKGFIAHTGGPSPSGGWRVVEIWESEADAQQWFDEGVKPNMPPGMEPHRSHHPLHTAFTK